MTPPRKAYSFNQRLMSQNPDVLVINPSMPRPSSLLLARSPDGRWCLGFEFNSEHGGCSRGPGYSRGRVTFQTRDAALVTGIDYAFRWARGMVRRGDESEFATAFLGQLATFQASLPFDQLTLFHE